MDTARDLLLRVQERMEAAARRANRKPDDVTLVAVTKTVSFERVLPFLQAGVRQVGENRVQEGLGKYSGLRAQGSEMPAIHLIGQLQSNKAKKAVGGFDMIQSLDRLDLAQDIQRHAEAIGKIQACLIEVKISPEGTKSGLPPDRLDELLGQLQTMPNIEVRGLMGIPPMTNTPEESRPYFQRLRELFERSTGHGSRPTFNTLSMGMSSDFEIAIEEGSTMVRLGTVLFGHRS